MSLFPASAQQDSLFGGTDIDQLLGSHLINSESGLFPVPQKNLIRKQRSPGTISHYREQMQNTNGSLNDIAVQLVFSPRPDRFKVITSKRSMIYVFASAPLTWLTVFLPLLRVRLPTKRFPQYG